MACHLDMGPMPMLSTMTPSRTHSLFLCLILSTVLRRTHNGRTLSAQQSIYINLLWMIMKAEQSHGEGFENWRLPKQTARADSKTIKIEINNIIFKLKFITSSNGLMRVAMWLGGCGIVNALNFYFYFAENFSSLNSLMRDAHVLWLWPRSLVTCRFY